SVLGCLGAAPAVADDSGPVWLCGPDDGCGPSGRVIALEGDGQLLGAEHCRHAADPTPLAVRHASSASPHSAIQMSSIPVPPDLRSSDRCSRLMISSSVSLSLR